MKICCFDDASLRLIEGDIVIDVSAALSAPPPSSWPYSAGDAVFANWAALDQKIPEIMDDAPRRTLAEIWRRSPVANPSKIIGIARNRKNLDQENLGPGNDFAKGRGESDPMHPGSIMVADFAGLGRCGFNKQKGDKDGRHKDTIDHL